MTLYEYFRSLELYALAAVWRAMSLPNSRKTRYQRELCNNGKCAWRIQSRSLGGINIDQTDIETLEFLDTLAQYDISKCLPCHPSAKIRIARDTLIHKLGTLHYEPMYQQLILIADKNPDHYLGKAAQALVDVLRKRYANTQFIKLR